MNVIRLKVYGLSHYYEEKYRLQFYILEFKIN